MKKNMFKFGMSKILKNFSKGLMPLQIDTASGGSGKVITVSEVDKLISEYLTAVTPEQTVKVKYIVQVLGRDKIASDLEVKLSVNNQQYTAALKTGESAAVFEFDISTRATTLVTINLSGKDFSSTLYDTFDVNGTFSYNNSLYRITNYYCIADVINPNNVRLFDRGNGFPPTR